MKLAVIILQNRLDALNYQYKNFLQRGGAGSLAADVNRDNAKELAEAIEKLKK